MNKVLTFILAGGKGERLFPLTKDRAKPAVPFGGIYRIIDFSLSNCINSFIRKIHVLTQYKSISLQRHLRQGWNIFNSELGEYIDMIPAQQRVGSDWYKGTADAIFQNIYTIEQEKPQEVLILAGDHIYKMDYAKMIRAHREKGADVTVGVVQMQKDKVEHLGVIEVDKNGKILGFHEKSKSPPTLPGNHSFVYASMGIYVFNREVLEEEVTLDANKDSEHDFGKNIMPQMISKKRVIVVYNLKENGMEENPYWRDVGTIEAYYEANMDLVSVDPEFNLYDKEWPIRTYQEQHPPAKTVHSGEEITSRIGLALDSIISSGCVVSGGKVQHSILSPNVRINSFSQVYDSILFEGVNVGRHSMIKKAIIDKDVNIPEKTVIGYDREDDQKRFFVTDSGIAIVPKRTKL